MIVDKCTRTVGGVRIPHAVCVRHQGSNFESCVWKTVSSHHPQEVLLAQFSLYVHKGGLKPNSFHFFVCMFHTGLSNILFEFMYIRPRYIYLFYSFFISRCVKNLGLHCRIYFSYMKDIFSISIYCNACYNI